MTYPQLELLDNKRENQNDLKDAFLRFSEVSEHLSEHFSMLQLRVQYLTEELERKNRKIRILESHAERNRRMSAFGDISTLIAHKIRNPLGSISIYSSLLEKDLAKQPKSRRLAENIGTDVRRMDLILSNMLISTRAPKPNLSEVSGHKLVFDTIKKSNMLLEGAQIQLSMNLDAENDIVLADVELYQQVLLNLILNSVQSMQDTNKGKITILSENGIFARDTDNDLPIEEECFIVKIMDNGGGISEDIQNRIFDPFFTTRARSAGLGLSSSHNIIEVHQGTLQLESKYEIGTTVTVKLPTLKSRHMDLNSF